MAAATAPRHLKAHLTRCRIAPENVSLLGGSMASPQCNRHGGQLKSEGRINEKLFAAKLFFRATRIGPTRSDGDETI